MHSSRSSNVNPLPRYLRLPINKSCRGESFQERHECGKSVAALFPTSDALHLWSIVSVWSCRITFNKSTKELYGRRNRDWNVFDHFLQSGLDFQHRESTNSSMLGSSVQDILVLGQQKTWGYWLWVSLLDADTLQNFVNCHLLQHSSSSKMPSIELLGLCWRISPCLLSRLHRHHVLPNSLLS